ncbi:unnamed protein product, partial [marine sediment metagenome]
HDSNQSRIVKEGKMIGKMSRDLRTRLHKFVDLDGEARAHPGADSAGIALLGMGKGG